MLFLKTVNRPTKLNISCLTYLFRHSVPSSIVFRVLHRVVAQGSIAVIPRVPTECDFPVLDLTGRHLGGRGRLRSLSVVCGQHQASCCQSPTQTRFGRHLEFVVGRGFQIDCPEGSVGWQKFPGKVGRIWSVLELSIGDPVVEDLSIGLAWDIPNDTGSGQANIWNTKWRRHFIAGSRLKKKKSKIAPIP